MPSLFRSSAVVQSSADAPAPLKLFTCTDTCWSVAVTKVPRCRSAPSSEPLTANQRRGSTALVGVTAAIATDPPVIETPNVSVPIDRLSAERPKVSNEAATEPP